MKGLYLKEEITGDYQPKSSVFYKNVRLQTSGRNLQQNFCQGEAKSARPWGILTS